jgi:hypothetical protein
MGRDSTVRWHRLAATSVALVVGGLLLVAIWMSVDNPEIGPTSRGDKYQCLAPWDTVLLRADNYPGGEPPEDADQIAARCRDAGEERFTTAAFFGVAAGAVLGGAWGIAAIRDRRGRRTTAAGGS